MKQHREIIEELLKGLSILEEFHEPPEVIADQFADWLNSVSSILDGIDMREESDIWNEGIKGIRFSHDYSLVVAMSTAKATLLRIFNKYNMSISDYINLTRIDELRSIASTSFDLSKLIRMCEELNICYSNHAYFATSMLIRSILDHVPPLFDCRSFSEVVNNYKGGKSFKEAMTRLECTSRKIADTYLHTQIRKSESLPNSTQVNFDSELDLLLAEVYRILKVS